MFKFFKLNKRELNLLVLCCIIIVTALSYVMVIEPFLKRYGSIKEQNEIKLARFLKLRRILLLKEPVELSYLEVLPRISQVGSDEEKSTLFLKEIELNSRHSDIYIISLKPIGVLEEADYKEYLITMEAEGDMSSLAKFLYSLPESGQLISLKKLQINYLSQRDNLLQFQMHLGRMVADAKDE